MDVGADSPLQRGLPEASDSHVLILTVTNIAVNQKFVDERLNFAFLLRPAGANGKPLWPFCHFFPKVNYLTFLDRLLTYAAERGPVGLPCRECRG